MHLTGRVQRGLAIVEDVAQAHGGTLGATRLGLLGDLASFSFYPTKNLGCHGRRWRRGDHSPFTG
ncbi:MAG: DegT/DnrJ/EryC1/StrS family aminotransferase [Marmoricola sp.]